MMQNQAASENQERYSRIKEIGGGAFGVVYKAIDRQQNRLVAIKEMRHKIENEGLPSIAIREVSLLKQLESKYIVKLLNQYIKDQNLCLVFEYIPLDLHKYMHCHNGRLTQIQIKKLMFQLLEATNYMHNCRIMHRDLKPQNILVEVDSKNKEEFQVKIADLGMARTYCLPIRPYSQDIITANYRAIELFLGMENYSSAVDIWSIGCIFAELVLGQVFLRGDSDLDMIFRICRTMGIPNDDNLPGVSQLSIYKMYLQNENMPDYQQSKQHLKEQLSRYDLDPLGQDLFFRMMTYDPKQRVTAYQALSHPYFNNLIP